MIDLFSTPVRVPVSTLQEHARKLRAYADSNADIFDRIGNAMDALREDGQWVGASQEAASLATEQNMRKYEQAVDELNKLADFLQDLADEMAREDEAIRQQIERVAPQRGGTRNDATKVVDRITYWSK